MNFAPAAVFFSFFFLFFFNGPPTDDLLEEISKIPLTAARPARLWAGIMAGTFSRPKDSRRPLNASRFPPPSHSTVGPNHRRFLLFHRTAQAGKPNNRPRPAIQASARPFFVVAGNSLCQKTNSMEPKRSQTSHRRPALLALRNPSQKSILSQRKPASPNLRNLPSPRALLRHSESLQPTEIESLGGRAFSVEDPTRWAEWFARASKPGFGPGEIQKENPKKRAFTNSSRAVPRRKNERSAVP